MVCRLLPPNHLTPIENSSYIDSQVGCCVSLHPLVGAEHRTISFPNPCRQCLHYLRFFFFNNSGAALGGTRDQSQGRAKLLTIKGILSYKMPSHCSMPVSYAVVLEPVSAATALRSRDIWCVLSWEWFPHCSPWLVLRVL